MRMLLFCLTLGLTACAEWPDAGGPTMSRRSNDWPTLLPLSQILESGTIEAAEDEDAARLSARAEALRNRARILRANAGDIDAMEALRARLRR